VLVRATSIPAGSKAEVVQTRSVGTHFDLCIGEGRGSWAAMRSAIVRAGYLDPRRMALMDGGMCRKVPFSLLPDPVEASVVRRSS
jgi:hypothetical protein